MNNRTNKSFGSIFYRSNKKTQRSPDAGGTFELTPDLIQEIANQPPNERGLVEVDVVLWNKDGPRAGRYLSGFMEVKKEQRNDQPKRRRDEDEEIPF